ncbi:hypothetical protein Ancab_028967, partial [Ancistrocladus abbreviatus]
MKCRRPWIHLNSPELLPRKVSAEMKNGIHGKGNGLAAKASWTAEWRKASILNFHEKEGGDASVLFILSLILCSAVGRKLSDPGCFE